MKRLIVGHLFVLWSFAQASELTQPLALSLEGLGQENCVERLSSVSSRIDNLTPEQHVSLLSTPSELRQELWQYRLNLSSELRRLYAEGELVSSCANAIRGALRATRTLDDYAHEREHSQRAAGTSYPSSAFAESNPYVKWASGHGPDLRSSLRSGDVLLTRGNAYSSAAIASLGEYNTQFSHMSLVHIDESGKIWTVEAHIEVGSFIRPLEDHISDNNMRTQLLRFENPALAARAAKIMFDKVRHASRTRGNILYDFGFDQEDSSELFCSEVISLGFAEASNQEVQIPYVQSRLTERKTGFLEDLGITADKSFVPADIEIDPRFLTIAEWKDAARIRDNLQKDAILHAMFKWNDDMNYRLVQGSSRQAFIYRNIAWPLRRVPFIQNYFDEKLPLNMSRRLIGFFGVLESVGELLHEQLIRAEDRHVVEARQLLLPSQRALVLEEYRERDANLRRPRLHRMYRPQGVKD